MHGDATTKAGLLYDVRAVLGEGPVWDDTSDCLYWVDIEGKKLHRYDPASGGYQSWDFDGMVGAVIPCEDGKLIVAHEKEMLWFDPVSGYRKSAGLFSNPDSRLRFNDGKCDPYGNILIGTMDKKLAPNAGCLYRLGGEGGSRVLLRNTSISNGMAWSPDQKYFYYIDSPTYEIWRFDYITPTASLDHKKVVVKVPEKFGAPDGMTIDTEGKLWVAHWDGNCVRQWDPETGKVLVTVEVDAPQVTSCCFGGEGLSTLYITTARGGMEKQAIDQYPLSGGLFQCRPGSKGLPAFRFQLKTL